MGMQVETIYNDCYKKSALYTKSSYIYFYTCKTDSLLVNSLSVIEYLHFINVFELVFETHVLLLINKTGKDYLPTSPNNGINSYL